jgi:hypothetical protein
MAGHKMKKGTKEKKLNPSQIEMLKEHAPHHTKKHMEVMKAEMAKGKSFSAAHTKAMSKVGK